MYELMQVGTQTYYVNCPARMGIYVFSENEACLIDSGNDKETGKKVLKILEANGWSLKMILNTHSHADHIGGNNLLQQRTGCSIFAPGIEQAFVRYPLLESSMLYGGFPMQELRNKFLLAQESNVQELTPELLPQGLTMLRLDGHSMAMAAIKTSDDVWFLADSLSSETILHKYHIAYLYDIHGYLQSLETVKTLDGRLFIPAHAEPCADISALADVNIQKAHEIMALICKICVGPANFESILKSVFDHYDLHLDFNQYVLVGSTLRSYISYLHDKGELHADFAGNILTWKTAHA